MPAVDGITEMIHNHKQFVEFPAGATVRRGRAKLLHVEECIEEYLPL
jgi:hypothetical protein